MYDVCSYEYWRPSRTKYRTNTKWKAFFIYVPVCGHDFVCTTNGRPKMPI